MNLLQHNNTFIENRPREIKLPIKGKVDLEFVPAYFLNKLSTASLSHPPTNTTFDSLYNFIASNTSINFLEESNKDINNIPYLKLLLNKLGDINRSNSDLIKNETELALFIENFNQAIHNWTYNSNLNYDLSYRKSLSNVSYETLITNLEKNRFTLCKTRSYDLLTNYGSCFHLIGDTNSYKSVIPLFILVVKPKYIPYLRNCWLMRVQPNHKIFKLWVNPEFSSGTSYKYFVNRYKKFIVSWANTNNIEIIEKEDILNELFNTIQVPKEITNLKSRKEWVNNVSSEVLEHLNVQNSIKSKFNIDITM